MILRAPGALVRAPGNFKTIMKQVEATLERPFYSVGYHYVNNPWTLHGCNRFSADGKRTMSGTDDFELAKRVADRCVTEPGISYAQVSKTVDCYTHETVYKVHAATR